MSDPVAARGPSTAAICRVGVWPVGAPTETARSPVADAAARTIDPEPPAMVELHQRAQPSRAQVHW